MNVLDLSLCALADKIRSREVSAVEAVTECLKVIDERADLNNFITVCKDEALIEAAKADGIAARGSVGDRPLLGVPVAVKDNIEVKGVRCTCASNALSGNVAERDADSVKKLRAAGAIVIGKTNMDEFAMGSSTENSAFGAAKNYLDSSRVPGGSSGGSANCVAARQAFGALGSDTGGSVRQPAAFCGVVGLKPTYSRISRDGLLAVVPTLDQIGILARDCDDAYALLKATQAFGERNVPDELGAGCGAQCELRGKTLGTDRRFLEVEGLDPDVKKQFERALAEAESSGARIVELDIPAFAAALDAYHIISSAEAFDCFKNGKCGLPSIDVDRLGGEVRRRLVTGAFALGGDNYDNLYIKACKVRAVIKEQYERALEICDGIVCPTSPTVATPLGSGTDPYAVHACDKYAAAASLAGLPAVSVPFGLAYGLPTGVQIICGRFRDKTALDIGKAIMGL